jgi:8-amino-7-oxononanoate synthase
MDSCTADRLSQCLDSLQSQGRYRALRPGLPLAAGRIARQGRVLLNMSSNDYLGLALHPALIARAQEWGERWGVGATASRLVCGTFAPYEQIETKLAALKASESALVLNSGFQANQAVISALLSPDLAGPAPQVFADRLIHASMYEGLRAAAITPRRFRHNDLEHLDSLLTAHPSTGSLRLILVESVYSMDGDRADLSRLADIAQAHAAFLYVDEAHATGVLGPQGRGLSAQAAGRIDLIMGTFGKALGGFGAYVATSAALREYLINRCGGLIYSTALPPPVLAAMDAALDLLPSLDGERARVAAHAHRLRQAITQAGGNCGASTTQIVPVILGQEQRALSAMQALDAQGILAVAIRPPTVPPGTARLRLALSAAHSDADIDTLIEALLPWVKP